LTAALVGVKAGNENHVTGDHYNTFRNIAVVGYLYNSTAAAIQVVPQSKGTTFRGIRAKNCAYGIRLIDNSSASTLITTDVVVEDCDFEDVAVLSVIDGGSSATLSGVTIQGCTFTRASTALTVNNADKVRIWDNVWIDPAQADPTYAVYCQSVTHLQVKRNDMSGSARGVKLSGCTNARVYRNVMHDLSGTTIYEDAGGNTGAYVAENDWTGFTPYTSYPNPPGVRYSGTGPSSQQVISTAKPYAADGPAQHGYTEWNYDPLHTQSSSGTVTAGTVYRVKLTARTGGTVSTIDYDLGTVGTGTSPANAYFAIYDDTGARLAITADFSSTLTSGSTGIRSVAFAASTTLTAGRDYYVEFLLGTQAGTTAVTLGRAGTVIGILSANQTNAQTRFGQESTSQSALPSSITPSTLNSSTSGLTFWVGLR
jgi:hypothetical protein